MRLAARVPNRSMEATVTMDLRERIAGFLLGIGFGTVIGYFLRRNSHESPEHAR